jgi:hypothetical protein
MCREALNDEAFVEEDINQELQIITSQLAFVYQIQGKAGEALEIYSQMLSSK